MTWDDVIGGLTAKDKALFKKMCPILRNIRGTTAYWHRERQNLFAMLRELSVPSWFFTITANEAGWPELICELLALEVRARDFLLEERELVVQVVQCFSGGSGAVQLHQGQARYEEAPFHPPSRCRCSPLRQKGGTSLGLSSSAR